MTPSRSADRVGAWTESALGSARRALRVPQEDADWQVRNWCEILAILVATGNASEVRRVDRCIETSPIRSCSAHFARRLHSLRRCAGEVPGWWPRGAQGAPTPPRLREPERGVLRALLAFGDALARTAVAPKGLQEVRIEVVDLAPLLVSASPLRVQAGVECIGVDASAVADLIWRRWFRFPTAEGGGAACLLVPGDTIPRVKHLVWTGVHDATHLIHLADPQDVDGAGPSAIEFNDGLVLAESVAMAAELIAASTARRRGTSDVAHILWEGLAERIGRVTTEDSRDFRATPDAASPTLGAALAASNPEFGTLPTLARAYTFGALALAARGFRDPRVPADLGGALRERWQTCVQADEAFGAMDDGMRRWIGGVEA